MEIFRSHRGLPARARGAVLALGNFDGVHRGHRAVIGTAARAAEELRAPLGVVVFEPHPRRYFAPHTPAFSLTRLETKARLVSALGVDFFFALPFDQDLATMGAQAFVVDVLAEGLGLAHAVAGADFRFGQGRGGDMTLLAYMGEMEGFGVTTVAPVFPDDGPAAKATAGDRSALAQISSSAIRVALQDGRPVQAARLLGRPWAVEGRVSAGDQRGRTIGFPTANVTMDGLLEPRLGVYAVLVEVFAGPHTGTYEGVANLGRRPTFGHSDVVLEAHLFDFLGDLYDQPVAVSLLDFLRPERKFDGLEALKAQIRFDCENARAGFLRAQAQGVLPAML